MDVTSLVCFPNYIPFAGKTWSAAKRECTSRGGDLAGPLDAAVDDFLAGQLLLRQLNNDGSVTGSMSYWIGLRSEPETQSPLHWTDQSFMDFVYAFFSHTSQLNSRMH